jgi:hypothetical protein
MARNNFNFQKRQKELAKKKKREEKLARRQERKQEGADGLVLAKVNEFGEVIEEPAEPQDAEDEATAETEQDEEPASSER